MTDRGLPGADVSPACPFVAFEDDRDERADRPDHRHRCYAEAEPAPRALAHQEAYCLSSAFPVCPVFQDWARREAAHARSGGVPAAAPTPASSVVDTSEDPGAGADEDGDAWPERPTGPDVEERPRRNPRRDWAAPPPWASGSGAAAGPGGPRRAADADVAAEFLASRSEEGRGLAGSAADRLAGGGRPLDDAAARPRRRPIEEIAATPADPELAGLVGGGGLRHRGRTADPAPGPAAARSAAERPAHRPTVSSTRDRGRDRDRERERERAAAERDVHDGPSWERQRRYEAYPSLRTRAGLSGVNVPRVAVLFGALAVAAVALFFLPALLGVGGPDRPNASGTTPPASAEPSVATSPTPIPEPTPQTYTVRSGDNLSRIARQFGVTVDQILEANKDTISNPNRISVGQVIVIPIPVTDEVPGAEPSPSG
jgi:nucleoid-associated protein YgaU